MAPGCVTSEVAEDSGSYLRTERQVTQEDAPVRPLLLVVAMDLQGGALRGAHVELEGSGSRDPQRYRTGPNGTVEPNVLPGQWRITVSSTGYAPVSAPLVVRTGESCVVRAFLRLHPASVTAELRSPPIRPEAPAR